MSKLAMYAKILVMVGKYETAKVPEIILSRFQSYRDEWDQNRGSNWQIISQKSWTVEDCRSNYGRNLKPSDCFAVSLCGHKVIEIEISFDMLTNDTYFFESPSVPQRIKDMCKFFDVTLLEIDPYLIYRKKQQELEEVNNESN